MTPGRRFMMDLLVGSLMADGGLESALDAAVHSEVRELESQKEKDIAEPPGGLEAVKGGGGADGEQRDKRTEDSGSKDISSSIPLLQLVQQLLKYAISCVTYCTAMFQICFCLLFKKIISHLFDKSFGLPRKEVRLTYKTTLFFIWVVTKSRPWWSSWPHAFLPPGLNPTVGTMWIGFSVSTRLHNFPGFSSHI